MSDEETKVGKVIFNHDPLYKPPMDPSQATLARVNLLASKIDSLDKRVTELICKVDSIMGIIERNGCDLEIL